MAGLGDVLRGLGSVLNPQVMQAADQEEAQKRQAAQQIQMLMLRDQMEQNSPEAKAKMAALARAEEARSRMAAATTPEERRAIAMEYATPDAVVRAETPRPTVVPANSTVMAPDNRTPLYTAPAAPGADNRPEILRLQEAAQGLPEGDPRRTAILSRIDTLSTRPEKSESVSPLGRLMAERDALPPGDPRRRDYDRVIAGTQSAGGTHIVNNNGGMPLGKEASNKVDTGLLDTTQGIMRLSAIESQYKPEYQQWGSRISAGWTAVKDSMGANVGTQDKQFLTQFSAYKRNAINSMNEYIKAITGAAMSEQEAQRILRGMPNPGQGLFDGDSPTEFKAKLDDAMKQTKMSLARYEYIKRNGMALMQADGKTPVISLERMPQIMNERAKVLEAELKRAAPNATTGQLEDRVRQLLAKEFGLVK